MAVAASLLRSEMRRHLMMNLGLVASCVVGGTVVTNERGLFVPLGIHSMSETAKAFAAMFTPSHLLPGFVNVQMVVPLEPFDVTADSRDLRRRLMEVADSTGGVGDTAETQTTELAQGYNPSPTLTVTELRDGSPSAGIGASKDIPSTSGGGKETSTSSTPSTQTSASAPTAPTGGTDTGATTGQGGTTNQSTANTASTGTFPTTNTGTNVGSTLATTNDDSTANVTAPIDPVVTNPPVGGGGTAVPEPSVWVMMLAGFGAVGYALRSARRRRAENDAEMEAA